MLRRFVAGAGAGSAIYGGSDSASAAGGVPGRPAWRRSTRRRRPSAFLARFTYRETPMSERDILEALAEPFRPEEVKWKAQSIKNNRALAVAYIDARVVAERLDSVLGVVNWEDRYEVLSDGNVVCTLRVRIGGEWIAKSDVGGESGQPDEGDRKKAAFSDALKRAAVKFGIGRYLYRLPASWVDCNPQTKQLNAKPPLPSWALPGKQKGSKPEAPGKAPGNGPGKAEAPATGSAGQGPASKAGPALVARLNAKDAELADLGLSRPGDLLAAVAALGEEKGFPARLVEWTGEEILQAAALVKSFEADCQRKARQRGGKPLPIREPGEEG
jgi:hypothetical protein